MSIMLCRSKDVIKSGGEWISSIQLENAAMGHPKVLEASVIGIPDAKWSERPLLVVVPQTGFTGWQQLNTPVLLAKHVDVQ
jgi:fatty-acyl-CoA synthase